jgi:hypothetical protein
MEGDAGFAAVRAFLEACDADVLGVGSEEAAEGLEEAAARPAGGRTPSRRGYSTQLQRRKRAEIDALRDYARELETRLAALQHKEAVFSQLASDGVIPGKSVALARLEVAAAGERRLRRRAESANQQLRAEMERCGALHAAIAQLIDKHQRQRPGVAVSDFHRPSASSFASPAVPEFASAERRLEAIILQSDGSTAAGSRPAAPFKLDLERCVDLRTMITRLAEKHRLECSAKSPGEHCSTIRQPNPFTSQVVLSPSDIEQKLEAMVRQVDDVFAWSPSRSTAPCWLETNRLSDGAEIRSSTTSGCGVATAESLLWITPGFSSGKESWCANMLSEDGNSYAKVFVMPLSCRPWTLPTDQKTERVTVEVPLKVQHFARKVADASTGRLMIAMLAVLELPGLMSGERPQFVQERAWTLVTPTTSGTGSAGSTVQTCYRLSGGDQPEGKTIEDAEPRAMRTSVMRSLVSITRRHRSMMQNWLLEAAEEW